MPGAPKQGAVAAKRGAVAVTGYQMQGNSRSLPSRSRQVWISFLKGQ
jgi:hypothetical protein